MDKLAYQLYLNMIRNQLSELDAQIEHLERLGGMVDTGLGYRVHAAWPEALTARWLELEERRYRLAEACDREGLLGKVGE